MFEDFPLDQTKGVNENEQKELIDAIAEKANISKKEAGEVLDATLDVIKEAVAKDDKVQLIGFWYLRGSQARGKRGQKPRTGEKIKIAAAKVPRLQGGAAFKDAVNK